MEREMKIILIMLCLASAKIYGFERYAHPTEAIIFIKTDIEQLKNSLYPSKSAQLVKFRHLGDKRLALASVPMGFDIKQFKQQLMKNKHVQNVVPNYIYLGDHREFIPNDPLFKKQIHHLIMKNDQAWEIATGKEEVVIAVTDDGFKLDHEDLLNSWFKNNNEIPNNEIDDDQNGYIDDVIGYDFNEMDNNPMSDSRHGSHGTHVAGIVGAGFSNNIGVSGHGPKIKVMPIKFYGKNTWTSAIVMESYTYAANNGANIITTSYYIDGFVGDAAYEKALDYAYSKGLILFNSAGNGGVFDSKRTAFTKLILVASTKSNAKRRTKIDRKSSFSNYGRGVDIAAPGDPIHSTGRSLKYVDMSGTSMAAPNAAASAALIWSVHPEYTREQVVAKLFMGTDNINRLNNRYKNYLGAGRVNAKESLSEVHKAPHVIEARYIKKSNELRIHLWGILSQKSISRSGGITLKKSTNKGDKKISVKLKNKYFLGTNELILNVPESGTYQLIMNSKKILDPFGQELDGDHNGQAGGDFVYNFTVR
jgi:subtilisin family serine protease